MTDDTIIVQSEVEKETVADTIAETVTQNLTEVVESAVAEAVEETEIDGTWLESKLSELSNVQQQLLTETRDQNRQLSETNSRLLEMVTRMAEAMTRSAVATVIVAETAADSSSQEPSAEVVTVEPEIATEPANVEDQREAETKPPARLRHRRI